MKQFLSAIIAVLSLCAWVGAASTTQPAVHVRDCTAQADTTQPVADGDTLYLSQLPSKWTLSYDFGLAPGHAATATFAVDGGKPITFMQPPYCPAGHNTPLFPTTAPVGSHAVVVVVNGKLAPSLRFNLANAPPATQPSVPATWGANYIVGASSQANNPAIHPILASTQTALNQRWGRLWAEYPSMVQQGDSYWTVCRAWKSRGFKVSLQYQGFTDEKNHGVPPSAQYIDFARRVVASRAVDAVLWGNEIDQPSGYFSGKPADLVQMLQTVCPITHAGGIFNVGPSTVHGIASVKAVAASGVYGLCDAIDVHAYGTAAQVVTLVQQAKAIAISLNKPLFVSECGTNTPAGTTAMLLGLKGIDATIFPYSQVPCGNARFPAQVLDATYADDPNYFSAYAAGMK